MSINTEILENAVVQYDKHIIHMDWVQATCKPGDELPDLGTAWSHRRDHTLRKTVHLEKFWASSVRKAISIASAQAWAIAGAEADTVREAHEMFVAANTVGYDRRGVAWGHGWDCFLNQHLRAYLLTGNGAFTQVVYNGARVVGFVHLDPGRCERTNDAHYPVIYHSDSGEIDLACHEVFMLSDFTDENTSELGCGMCAADRAYDEIRIQAVAQRRYWERISGRKIESIEFVGGLNEASLQKIDTQAEEQAEQKGYFYYKGKMIVPVPSDVDLSHVTVPVAGVDADYDRKRDWEIATYRYALALDIDPQELGPIDRGGLGSGSQSRVLDDKASRTCLFGWDKNFMQIASRLILDSKTKFYFTDNGSSDTGEKAESLGKVAAALKDLTDGMILNPDQAIQVGVDCGVLPSEFAAEQHNGTHTLRRDDRSTLLHEAIARTQAEEDATQQLEDTAKNAARYADINFKIPADVKNAAERGLRLRREHGRGGTDVGIATARALVGNENVTPEKVRHIARYWPRHAGDNLDHDGREDRPLSNGYIAWLLWGGDPGRRWSEALVKRLDAADERAGIKGAFNRLKFWGRNKPT